MRLILVVLIFLFAKVHSDQFEGFFSEYEYRRLDLIDRFLPEKPVIFEAGAHYGTETIQFVERWPEVTVISFEPNPHAFKELWERTKDIPNIYPYRLAASDYNGKATLYVCHGTDEDNAEYEGASSLLEPSEWMKVHYQGPKIRVPCVVLDDWCKENKVKRIDFMWLDLEGMELQVLKSSPKILGTVRVIYTETNFKEFRKGMTQFKDLRKFLEDSGFTLLAHWYREGLQGDAIFIKNEFFHQAFF